MKACHWVTEADSRDLVLMHENKKVARIPFQVVVNSVRSSNSSDLLEGLKESIEKDYGCSATESI